MFELEIADILEEGFGRVGVDFKTVTADDLRDALRKINLLFIHWENRIPKQWKIVEREVTTVANGYEYTLGSDVIGIFSGIYRNGEGKDTPIYNIGRDQYQAIYDKTIACDIPDRYWFDQTTTPPVLKLWVATRNAGETLVLQCLTTIEDAGGLRYNPDVPRRFIPALCSGMAWMLSAKYKPEMSASLKQEAIDDLSLAEMADNEGAPTSVSFDMSGYFR